MRNYSVMESYWVVLVSIEISTFPIIAQVLYSGARNNTNVFIFDS